MNAPAAIALRLAQGGAITLARAPEGYDAFVVADFTRMLAREAELRAVALTFVARDGLRAQAFIEALAFAAPEIEALYLPAWDCQPYDRVSPNAAISAQRMTALARLALTRGALERPRVLVTSVNAITQRVPPKKFVASAALSAAPGNVLLMEDLARWLEANGFSRASVVRDVGDYAQRGGILDLYAPGAPAPIRLDFFGDTLESIRSFDPETQRSVGQLRALDLVPMSEAQLTTETIRRFRQAYVAEFGAPRRGDALYETLSEGRRAIGLEHWLPLFYEGLDSVFDYVAARRWCWSALRGGRGCALRPDRRLLFRPQERRRAGRRHRRLRPLKPDRLYLSPEEWRAASRRSPLARLEPFEAAPGARRRSTAAAAPGAISRPSGRTRTSTSSRRRSRISRRCAPGACNVVVAGWSDGSRERLSHVLAEHGLKSLELVSSYPQAKTARAARCRSR